MTNVIKLYFFIYLAGVFVFISSLIVIIQTYEYRSYFSVLEELNVKKGRLISEFNFLSEEIGYLNNQNTINKVAREGMQMRIPRMSKIIRVKIQN
ncbi:MAG: cell division protein FtsL [SAR86 cluster bacterium]|jgi:cell division protein FtsL|nr:cell division protein FtsL [SAR86 cluster bacterium]